MQGLEAYLEEFLTRWPALTPVRGQIRDAYLLMEACYRAGGKLLIAGNGGSASDSEHIAGELMKRFNNPRPIPAAFAARLTREDPVRGRALAAALERALPAIALTAHEALSTAIINDAGGVNVYAQQLYGYGRAGDVFLGVSTSGQSENVLRAAVTARALDIKVIGLTGAGGGRLAPYCDVAVCVPETKTYLIQEYHLPIYHLWCRMLEDRFFGEGAGER